MARKRPQYDDDYEDDAGFEEETEARKLRRAVENSGHGREPLILGIIGGGIGLIALLLFCIPVIPLFIAGLGLLLSIIGIILALVRGNIGLLFPCLATGLCVTALAVNGFVTLTFVKAGRDAVQQMTDLQKAREEADARRAKETQEELDRLAKAPAAVDKPFVPKPGERYAIGYDGKRDLFGFRDEIAYRDYLDAKKLGKAYVSNLEGDGKIVRIDSDTIGEFVRPKGTLLGVKVLDGDRKGRTYLFEPGALHEIGKTANKAP